MKEAVFFNEILPISLQCSDAVKKFGESTSENDYVIPKFTLIKNPNLVLGSSSMKIVMQNVTQHNCQT